MKVRALFFSSRNGKTLEERIEILEAKVDIMITLNIAMFIAVFSLLLSKVL